MALTFHKATKERAKARVGLIGPSGSGKTFTALRVAKALAQGKPVAVIDTERGSASKYSDMFQFDVLELETYSPLTYVQAIAAAMEGGYEVLIIDSISHAWAGKEGALEQVDKAKIRSQSDNSYTAWRLVTPMHNALVDAILQYPGHVIVTFRAKTEYVLEEINGKRVPKKIGLAPIQRDGMEYEFDVVADLDLEHNCVVNKTRCSALDEKIFHKAGEADLGAALLRWTSGEPEKQKTVMEMASEQGITPEQLMRFLQHTYGVQDGRKLTAPQRKELAASVTSGTVKAWLEDPASFAGNAPTGEG